MVSKRNQSSEIESQSFQAASLNKNLNAFGFSTPQISLANGSFLKVLEVVRIVPDKRLVCRCLWNGVNVYAKVFIGRYSKRYAERDAFGWNDPCMAAKWLNYLKSDSSSTWDLIDVISVINELAEQGRWDSITSLAKEVLKVMWLNSFMAHTRKLWTKQSGAGSQNTEPLGYKVLAETVLSVLEKERLENEAANAEDEDFNPDQLELEFDEE